MSGSDQIKCRWVRVEDTLREGWSPEEGTGDCRAVDAEMPTQTAMLKVAMSMMMLFLMGRIGGGDAAH